MNLKPYRLTTLSKVLDSITVTGSLVGHIERSGVVKREVSVQFDQYSLDEM